MQATTTTSAAQSVNSSANNAALVTAGFAGGAALLLSTQLLSPVVPKLTSFGGKIVSVIPCSGGMVHVTIVPAGLFPVQYIWTPFTITKLYGAPIHPGQQLVGLADVPFVCFIGGGIFTSPTPLYGLRMTTVGTSMPGAVLPF
jgi:hypothetical protein